MSRSEPSYSDAPEVYMPSYPEAVVYDPYDSQSKIPVPESEPTKIENGHSYTAVAGNEGSAIAATSIPWWRRKRIIVPCIIGLVVAIALGVGLGVGLGSRKNDDPETSDDSSDSSKLPNLKPPSCDDSLCPRVLSSTLHQDKLYVFGRTKDNKIAWISHDKDKWDSKFFDLGAPDSGSGGLISQPASFSWVVHDKFPRLDVYTIAKNERVAYGKHYSEAEGWSEWKAEGPNQGSAIQLCRVTTSRLDLWSTRWDTSQITHTMWYQKPDDEISEDGLKKGVTTENGWVRAVNKAWDVIPELGVAKSAVAIVCPETKTYHQVLWYDKNRDRLLHNSYNEDKGWADEQAFEGKWIGDPSIWSFDDDEWHFLGVQEDRQMYHLSYNSKNGGYSSLTKLGGRILSVPSITFLEDNTIDIIALGTDSYLQHMHYDGKEWASDWENLEIPAYSAPLMDKHNDQLYIMALAEDGKLFTLSRNGTTTESKWKDSLHMESLGGNLTADYVTHED